MVRNEDIKSEFDLFADTWKMFKCLLPVGDKTDEKYWDEAVSQTKAIMNKYPGQLASDLSLAVLSELERRMKVDEDKNTGCNEIP